MNDLTASEQMALKRIVVEKWHDNQHQICDDIVAQEVPVALEYNGISHVVMLASPHNLIDFALGFSLSEGILQHPSELFDHQVSVTDDGILLKLEIATERFQALKGRRRNLLGRTGCGLCGAETLQQAIRSPQPVTSNACFNAEMIHSGMAHMLSQQHFQQQTGATHAAAWLMSDGTVLLVREDVGRHNALDKLIGALARGGHDFSSGAALITSRASYEMVQKAATLGIGFLAAISAPTSLAVQLAEQINVTLVGFVRSRPSHVIYAGSQRLLHPKSAELDSFATGIVTG